MTAVLQALPSPKRSWRMVQRNLVVYRHAWMTVFSGFFEPLFYLFAIGLGLGAYVADVSGISYAAFVAPGLLASSCLNGALSDGFFNVFFKLHFQRTYDGILASPMRVVDVAFGEMLWALIRGSLYAAGFLSVVLVFGWLSASPILLSPWAWLALPAAIVASAAFSALALLVTSVVTKVEQFDIVMGLGVMPMFLFSGIFFPVSRIPAEVAWIFQVVPLFHAVELLRALTTGAVDATVLWHLGYLIVVGSAAFVLAMARLERALVR